MTDVSVVAGGRDPSSKYGVNITTQTTTLVKAKPGTLRKIVVNAATANGTIAIRDHNEAAAAGTLKATITAPGTLLQNHYELEYNMAMDSGIVIITGGANQNITIIYE